MAFPLYLIMKSEEKEVSYNTVNTYSTLNQLTNQTKNVWIVLHGIGYLSRFFLKYFDELPQEENYIIAPQAPSKYYLNGQYQYVGASWLTKENTTLNIQNVINYLDAVLAAENIPKHCRLIIFGFSQGVSIATRWVALSKISCDRLLLYAGGIPQELSAAQFSFLLNKTKVTVIIGAKDAYLTQERMESEKKKINTLFKGMVELYTFEGGHEVKKEIINKLV